MAAGINRRGLLRAGAVGVVGTSALAHAPVAVAESSRSPAPGLMQQVRAAAREYGVPVALLLAMGYVNTRWEMPPPEASAYRPGDPEGRGSYGVMALVRNPTADTVGLAARLTGLSDEALMADLSANLRGGAAVLAHSQGNAKPAQPARWLGGVAGAGGSGPAVRATTGVGGGDLYAEQVGDVLARGFSLRTRSGEQVALSATDAGSS